MIRFLLLRPVPVLTGFVLLMVFAVCVRPYLRLGLLPEIEIPRITLHFSAEGFVAEQMERSLLRPLRSNLRHLAHLEDLESSAWDEGGMLSMTFDYGTDMKASLLEVHNRLDNWVSAVGKKVSRPVVHQASINDFPVAELALLPVEGLNANDFSAWSAFVAAVIPGRFEQLSGVSFADLSGVGEKLGYIEVHHAKLWSAGCDMSGLIASLEAQVGSETISSINKGNFKIQLSVKSGLNSLDDLKTLQVCGQENIRLQDIGEVVLKDQEESSLFKLNGTRGVGLRVYKKSKSDLLQLRRDIAELMAQLKIDYPTVRVVLLRDQGKLLFENVQSLVLSLISGMIFALFSLAFFFRRIQFILLIALVIPCSLLLSLAGFYVFGLSLDMLSLYGMIIGTGLVLDNGIIVLDNILMKLREGKTRMDACAEGTKELVGPLLASAVTTCIVFLPLAFQDGLTGALFTGQLSAIVIALTSSLLVSCLLLPLLIFLTIQTPLSNKTNKWNLPVIPESIENGIPWFYVFVLVGGIACFGALPKKVFPEISSEGLVCQFDWGHRLTTTMNDSLSVRLFRSLSIGRGLQAQFVGPTSFLLEEPQYKLLPGQWFYFDEDVQAQDAFRSQLMGAFSAFYPAVKPSVKPITGIFRFVFPEGETDQPLIKLRLTEHGSKSDQVLAKLKSWEEKGYLKSVFPLREHLLLSFNKVNALDFSTVLTSRDLDFIVEKKLDHRIYPGKSFYLRDGGTQELSPWWHAPRVQLPNSERVSLSEIASIQRILEPSVIQADLQGVFLPFTLSGNQLSPQDLVKSENVDLKFEIANSDKNIIGRLGKSRRLILTALLLLYLTLVVLFNSLLLPLMAVVVIPIGFAGALIALYWDGSSINMVALTGLIVTSGIVVNDAILKLDMIRRLEKDLPLDIAVKEAGRRRIRPILLTSLTTIFSMLPALFTSSLGTDFQRPLAVTLIGGLIFGTMASIWFVPYLYKKLS